MSFLLRYGITCAILIAVVFQGSLVNAAEVGELEPSAEAVAKAWRSQQDAVRSARFKLKGHQKVSTKGYAHFFQPAPAVEPVPLSEEVPNFLESNFEVTILFSGEAGAARIISDRPMYNAFKKTLLESHWDTTFDGHDHSRVLTTREGVAAPTAMVHSNPSQNQDVLTTCYKPIFLAFRPFSASFVGDPTLNAFSLSDRSESRTQSGLDSDLLCLSSGNHELWIDADKDFKLRKYIAVLRGKPFRKVEITKHKQTDDVWMPVEWNSVYYDFEGAPTSWYKYTVEESEINPPLTRADFQLKFPKGTEIHWDEGPGPEIKRNKRRKAQPQQVTPL